MVGLFFFFKAVFPSVSGKTVFLHASCLQFEAVRQDDGERDSTSSVDGDCHSTYRLSSEVWSPSNSFVFANVWFFMQVSMIRDD